MDNIFDPNDLLNSVRIPPHITQDLSPEDAEKAKKKYLNRFRIGDTKLKAFMIKFGDECGEQLTSILSDEGDRYKLISILDAKQTPEGFAILVKYYEFVDGKKASDIKLEQEKMQMEEDKAYEEKIGKLLEAKPKE